MKALYFAGETAAKTCDAYNQWAHGKPLAKDVIVHTEMVQPLANFNGLMLIIVFFDERLHPEWVGNYESELPADGIGTVT